MASQSNRPWENCPVKTGPWRRLSNSALPQCRAYLARLSHARKEQALNGSLSRRPPCMAPLAHGHREQPKRMPHKNDWQDRHRGLG